MPDTDNTQSIDADTAPASAQIPRLAKEAKSQAASTTTAENELASPNRSSLGRGWAIGGTLLLIILLGLAGYSIYFQQQHGAPSKDRPNADRSYGVTPTPAPSTTSVASPSATPSQGSQINLMPVNAKTVTLTPQVQGAAYDSAKVAVNAVTDQVRQDFAQADAKDLYALFSSDLQAMFTQADLAAALHGVGDIDLKPVGSPIISSEWAKQTVSYTHNGVTTTYDVILHKENGQWKLYGTVQSK